jgi:hypothetical protein
VYLVSDLILKWIYLILNFKSTITAILEKSIEIVKYILLVFNQNPLFNFSELEVLMMNLVLHIYIKNTPIHNNT